MFYVNEDYAASLASIHRSSCVYAQTRRKKPTNGTWHGPYTSMALALAAAHALNRQSVRRCQVCNPR